MAHRTFFLLFALSVATACGSENSGTGGNGGGSGGNGGGNGGSGGAAGASASSSSTSGSGGMGGSGGSGGSGGGSSETCKPVALAWPEELVDADCSNISLAVDAKGAAHLAFAKGSDSAATATAHYATNKTGPFVLETIDADPGRVRSTSIAIDAAGAAHVAFEKIPGVTIKYATNASGAWALEAIKQVSLGGLSPMLALGPSGAPVVAYGSNTSSTYVATPPAGPPGWTEQLASNAGGKEPSLWIDPTGDMSVSFNTDNGAGLFVASNAGGAWQHAQIGSGQASALVRTSDGKRHVSHLPPSGSSAELLHRMESSPGVWSEDISIHASSKYDFSAPSAAAAPDGSVVVVYSLSAGFVGCGVHIARLAAGSQAFSIERLVPKGTDPVVAIDNAGKLHLAYCRDGGLRYAKEP